MLYDIHTNKPVHIPKNKEMSDHMKRSVIEKLEPPPIKNDRFFKLEERARFI